MLKIGYDAKRYFLNKTGLGNYSRDLIRILQEFYPENKYIKYSPKVLDQSITNNTDNKLPKGFLNNLFKSIWRNSWIIKDLKRDGIEIFHGLSGEIPNGLKEAGIKSVVTIHDLIFLRYPELYKPFDRWIYNQKFKFAAIHADKIIAISQQTKNDIIQYYKIPAEKIEVIYQGCHPAFKTIKTEEQKQFIKKKFDLPDKFLLNVGSLERRKNAFQIVKAIETLDIPLVLVGKETAYSEEIRKFLKEKNMEGRVFFLKGLSMEELAIVYAMASIFIYPSKFEGFGIPIIEALYSGIPVVTTNSGVFPEAAGPFSYYINPEHPEEIKKAIIAILNSESMRMEMINKGHEYVQHFNDDKIAERLIKLYQSI